MPPALAVAVADFVYFGSFKLRYPTLSNAKLFRNIGLFFAPQGQ
jgi:hypothetical protein